MTIRNVRDLPASHQEAIKSLRDPKQTEVDGTDLVLTPTVADNQEVVLETDPLDELDMELQELAAEAEETRVDEEPQAVPQTSPAEQMRNDILSMLSGHPDAPSAEQIDAWKEKVGVDGLQAVAFDRGNVFVFTHLTVSQWERIQEIMQSAQNNAQAQDLQRKLRDTVVRSAVVWPKLDKDWFRTARAGLPDTLYELILVNSYFLTTQQAMTLTTQL
jgi:hypothetical protein